MSTGAIVAIGMGAVALIALFGMLSMVIRRRRLDSRREQATELRQEARSRELRAKQAQAEAEEKAATARRESAAAEERAQVADRERRFARERHSEAQSIDPDVDDDATGDDRAQESRNGGDSRERAASRRS